MVVDAAQTFQTIEGWGNGSDYLSGGIQFAYRMLGPAVANPVHYSVIDHLVDDLGLTGTRLGYLSWGHNDNGDCDVLDEAKFLAHRETNWQMTIAKSGRYPRWFEGRGDY